MMVELIALEVAGLGIAFGLGYLSGRARRLGPKVKVPDHVPAEWKISKGDE